MSESVKEIKDAGFSKEVIESKIPVLVDFWASWCGPCKAMAPVVEEVAKDFDGKVKVVKINIDDNAQSATNFGVMSIPTFMIFKGGKEVDRVMGVNPKSELEKRINKVLGG